MILSIKAIVIASIIAFLSGNLSGIILTAKLYNISAMRAKINALKEDKLRYVKAIGVSKDIDAATSEIDISNDEIEALIAEKISAAIREKERRREIEKTGNRDPIAPANIDSMCIDADVLRAIGKLR
jgi:hypothetical protein